MGKNELEIRLEDILTLLAWQSPEIVGGFSRKRMLKHLLGLFIRTLTKRLSLPAMSKEESSLIVFQSFLRPDYDELVDNIVSAVGRRAILLRLPFGEIHTYRTEHFERIRWTQTCGRVKILVSQALKFRAMWIDAMRRRGALLGTWLYLHFLKNRLDLTPIVSARPEGVIVFAEMQPLDRILSMLCKENGIPCATLQHGIYAEYKAIETVNRYNYHPLFVSDFLAWGQRTAELIGRYSPSVVVAVCGKPTKKELRKSALEEQVFDMVLILDQNIFHKENQEIIRIAYETLPFLNSRIAIRFHPQNKPQEYETYGLEVVEGDDWLKARCCVGHTTSFLIDILLAGIPVLRFASGAESVFEDKRIEFTNAQELICLINADVSASNNVLKEYISKTGVVAINAHFNAIQDMCKRSCVCH
jgi:hypothetical protein